MPNVNATDLTRRNVELVARLEQAAQVSRTRGERVADIFAAVAGSWTFIIIQSVLLAFWMLLNVVAWWQHWDPYPFILLNLVMSFQAAYAAPIIMMSQNRQTKLAERWNHLDLQINMLAEQEATETLRLLRKICEKQGIPLTDESNVGAMTTPTEAAAVLEQIKNAETRPKA